ATHPDVQELVVHAEDVVHRRREEVARDVDPRLTGPELHALHALPAPVEPPAIELAAAQLDRGAINLRVASVGVEADDVGAPGRFDDALDGRVRTFEASLTGERDLERDPVVPRAPRRHRDETGPRWMRGLPLDERREARHPGERLEAVEQRL